jgi:hypothetical protein
VEEEDTDFRYPGPAPSTDKKSKEKGFFKALFRIGKSKKEAKTPAPKQAAVESFKDDDRRDNARSRTQYGRGYDRETADQDVAAMYVSKNKKKQKKTTAIRAVMRIEYVFTFVECLREYSQSVCSTRQTSCAKCAFVGNPFAGVDHSSAFDAKLPRTIFLRITSQLCRSDSVGNRDYD